MTRHQKTGAILFIVYLALLVYFMFFADSLGRDTAQEGYAYNLTLFREIRRFYVYREQLGMKAFLLNDIGNVIAFIPFGFFLPIVTRMGRRSLITVPVCFAFSLCLEVIQLLTRVGSFDVDDILLNTIGGILGFLLYRLLIVSRSWRDKDRKT